ncbi:hypothetical protein [Bacillus sp. AK031]
MRRLTGAPNRVTLPVRPENFFIGIFEGFIGAFSKFIGGKMNLSAKMSNLSAKRQKTTQPPPVSTSRYPFKRVAGLNELTTWRSILMCS